MGRLPPSDFRQSSPDDVIAALRGAANRFDRVSAIASYQAYEAATAARGEKPDDRVVEAYRSALWQPDSTGVRRSALPQPGTPYFGRSGETARVVDAVRARGSVVTITGVAGVGKSRLALAAAEHARSSFADDVCYLEFGVLADAAALFSPLYEQRDLETLLVLDLDTPLVEEARCEIERFARAHPRSSVLVASRTPTGAWRESLVELAPFALPPDQSAPPVIARTDAIAFFVERAALARPGFLYDASIANDLAQICALLDGLPLALELAAAQIRFFSLRELSRRVRRNDFAPTSLDATLDATIDLLDSDERRLFHRSAVFEAPFTVAEAEAVCSDERLEHDAVFPALVRLVERSLLQIETRDTVVRYRFLETIRRVALHAGEDERIAARERAVRWYTEPMIAGGLSGIPDAEAVQTMTERHSGMCCVLDRWCSDPALVLRAIVSTRKYWELRGLAAESLARIDARASTTGAAGDAFAFALARTIATHALVIGENERARGAIDRMLAIAELSGDDEHLVEAWHNGAILAYNAGELDAAAALLERAADLHAKRGAILDRARILMNLAAIDLAQREWRSAELRLASIAHLEHGPNEAVFIARNRAYAAAMRGELTAARAFGAEAVRRCDDPAVGVEWRVEVEHVLGVIAARSGDPYGSIRHQQRALLVAPRLPLRLTALPLEHAAIAAMEIGRPQAAAQLLGYVDEQRARTGLRRSGAFETFFTGIRREIEATLGVSYAEHRAIGASLTGERAAELAFSLPVAAPEGDALRTLSEREREVAALIATGATNREIAGRLAISVKTAENHLASIFFKLGAKRRTHVALIVREAQKAREP